MNIICYFWGLTNKKEHVYHELVRKSLGFITTGATFLFTAASVLAQTPAGTKVDLTAPTGSIDRLCLTLLPQFLIQLIFIIGVVIAVIFLIYGGIKWILSGGDKTAVEAARNHIIAAIIGLIIVVGAFFIIGLIFQLLGAKNPVTNLTINNLAGKAIDCTQNQ